MFYKMRSVFPKLLCELLQIIVCSVYCMRVPLAPPSLKLLTCADRGSSEQPGYQRVPIQISFVTG